MNDKYKKSTACTSHKGALSLFFNEGDTTNSFWDWVGQSEFNIDLDLVFTKTSSMTSQMWGYSGSDSEPTCTPSYCWYLNYPGQLIPADKLAQLKQKDVEWNNRALDIFGTTFFIYNFDGLLYTPATPPTSAAVSEDL